MSLLRTDYLRALNLLLTFKLINCNYIRLKLKFKKNCFFRKYGSIEYFNKVKTLLTFLFYNMKHTYR